MTQRFNKIIPWLFKWEGTVFEDDPDDPGGATKYGIDQRSHPHEDIRNLTDAGARVIYFLEYWTPLKCEQLPEGVGEIVFNIGVNCGKRRAAKWLQQCAGADVDCIIGPATIHAARSMDAAKLRECLLFKTEYHYRQIANGRMAKFLRGWLNRNNSLKELLA